jgi:hypothetical protein
MMSIISPVAQQCELINELDASLVGGTPAFQATCPFGYDGLHSTQRKMRSTYSWHRSSRVAKYFRCEVAVIRPKVASDQEDDDRPRFQYHNHRLKRPFAHARRGLTVGRFAAT